jgi:single-strand DNA-binding protein
MCIARYTLAVDRRFSRNNNNDGQNADFIPCVAFGKAGEHAEKYYRKGIKVAVSGRIQTGSYTNRDGVKVYTTDIIVDDQEFAESRNASQQGGGGSYSGNSYGGGGNNSYGGGQSGSAQSSGSIDGFMNIPDGIDEELPFT